MAPNKLSTDKDPVQLLEEADGNPQWLKEALEAIWQRLPPAPPSAPPATAQLPSWNPDLLAKLQVDSASVPLGSKDRWYLAEWLKQLAEAFIEGTSDEGDSHEGFQTIYQLKKTKPTSGARIKRNGV